MEIMSTFFWLFSESYENERIRIENCPSNTNSLLIFGSTQLKIAIQHIPIQSLKNAIDDCCFLNVCITFAFKSTLNSNENRSI